MRLSMISKNSFRFSARDQQLKSVLMCLANSVAGHSKIRLFFGSFFGNKTTYKSREFLSHINDISRQKLLKYLPEVIVEVSV